MFENLTERLSRTVQQLRGKGRLTEDGIRETLREVRIAPTALTTDGTALASFSNRSPLVTLAAPGDEVYGALDEQGYGSSSGTSMATPFVAATAALLRSRDRGLDPTLLRSVILQSGASITDGSWTGIALDMAAAVATVGPTDARVALDHAAAAN